MTIRLMTLLAVAALAVAGCSSDETEPQSDETTTTTSQPMDEEAPDELEGPPIEDDEVDFASRDVEGEPAPGGIVDIIQSMSIPDGAVRVTSANMIQYKDVYYVIAAVAETPDGMQILTYLHAPFDQEDLGNGGVTEPLNFAAQEWAPMAGASDDDEAYELGEQLIVERP